MYIEDWFDVNDRTHLEAFKHLRDTGFWPKDFISNEIQLHPNWQIALVAKMANEWLEYKLEGV